MLAAAGVVLWASPALTQILELKPYGVSVRYPSSWSSTPSRYSNAYELVRTAGQTGQVSKPGASRILITVEPRKDHADAIQRLQDIAREQPNSQPLFLSIGGWPALERLYASPLPPRDASGGETGPVLLHLTTAVAAASLVVRLESSLPADSPADIRDEVRAIGRSMESAQQGDPSQVGAEISRLRDSVLSGAPPPLPRSRVPRR